MKIGNVYLNFENIEIDIVKNQNNIKVIKIKDIFISISILSFYVGIELELLSLDVTGGFLYIGEYKLFNQDLGKLNGAKQKVLNPIMEYLGKKFIPSKIELNPFELPFNIQLKRTIRNKEESDINNLEDIPITPNTSNSLDSKGVSELDEVNAEHLNENLIAEKEYEEIIFILNSENKNIHLVAKISLPEPKFTEFVDKVDMVQNPEQNISQNNNLDLKLEI